MPYKNKQEHRDNSNKYYREHRERQLQYVKDYRIRIRKTVIEMYGGKCVRCGESDYRCLQLDHIHGGGIKELRSYGGTISVYLKALKHPEKYQLLCANCNWKKRYENDECSKRY